MTSRGHRILVANRGEIAVRIIRAAEALGIPTVAIYTPTDALSPHVSNATIAVALPTSNPPDPAADSRGYLDAHAILEICKVHDATLVHPGYGFLSENEEFARMLQEAGIIWLGPNPDTIRAMGLKHEARELAQSARVPVVPGSKGLLRNIDQAVEEAQVIGFPIILKSTAGGGGMGLVVCYGTEELRAKFVQTQERAKTLFKNDGVFLERYVASSRHIEVQVFGNGIGHVVHFGERECSLQRRHQKVIEETPSPFLMRRPDVRQKMCKAAVRLCESINYASAGTCEFLVDDNTGEFFFLEMNTRLQVEHSITEAVRPGLDIVKLMILQGMAQRDTALGVLNGEDLDQVIIDSQVHRNSLHAIEARVYCENAAAGFKPCPGLLQLVEIRPDEDWLRIDTWVETGTTITPYFDPLACKLIVKGSTRDEAIARMCQALSASKIHGPPNNMGYLLAICESERFRAGNAMTTFLDNFSYNPRAIEVLAGGLETTIQDYPGRVIGLGNPPECEVLEITLTGPTLRFHIPAVVAVTGATAKLTVDGQEVRMWERLVLPPGIKMRIGSVEQIGFRAYLAVRGGFPEVPAYLGSKSTSMGLGGYQGRALTSGDQLALGLCEPKEGEESGTIVLPDALVPTYTSDWIIHCLPGPHDDEEFITSEGVEKFYSASWKVSSSSNRMGIRLEGPKILWARKNGGEGGSHPSNIHDNGYAFGSVNINGDTPVILTNEGPNMGGYVCACTVVSADMWKVGQLRPGCMIQFKCVSFSEAMELNDGSQRYLQNIQKVVEGGTAEWDFELVKGIEGRRGDPKLFVIPEQPGSHRPRVIFRQAGDAAILIEYGPLLLDFSLRARIHAFESEVQKRGFKGIMAFGPCIRSTMCYYDPTVISQQDLLSELVAAENALPASMANMLFPSRKIEFPIVLDDQWTKEALERYMRFIRKKAVYLPSNIEYLANNNGLEEGGEEALRLLIASDWVVFGVGFYLACPFLVPVDPRCRLVGQKMNPSRIYTPRGAIGIAGLVAAIYPVESPGGYQLFGRTLPAWQTWGRGDDFSPKKPWLLQPFDQISFKPVMEEEYVVLEKEFDAGRYTFQIQETMFSMSDYEAFVDSIADEVAWFKQRQAAGVKREEGREDALLEEWEAEKAREREEQVTTKPTTLGRADGHDVGEHTIVAPLSATIWKILCAPGDVVNSAEQVVVVLEAMKTEVGIEAGEDAVGRVVEGFGPGVRDGAAVSAGDVLVVLK